MITFASNAIALDRAIAFGPVLAEYMLYLLGLKDAATPEIPAEDLLGRVLLALIWKQDDPDFVAALVALHDLAVESEGELVYWELEMPF